MLYHNKSGLDFLKILLLYATSNLSSLPFLQSLLNFLLHTVLPKPSVSESTYRTVYLVDSSTIRQDGRQQSQYRIHMCYNLNQNTMSQIKLSDNHSAESLRHYDIQKDDIFLADAGYGTAANYFFTQEQKADVVMRISPNHFPIYHLDGSKVQLLPLLKQAKKKGISSFEVTGYVKYQKQFSFVRLVIGNLPEEKVEKIRKRKRRRAQKDGCQIKEETLLYAGFVILAASLGKEYDREEILSIYRSRWQVELLFKRIKQNFNIQTIRAASKSYAFCLIYLWLIIWLLVEKQVIKAEQYLREKEVSRERISQWDLCRFYFIRTVELLELNWRLLIDPKDIYLLEHYLSTHVTRRKNKNNILHSEVLDSLIA